MRKYPTFFEFFSVIQYVNTTEIIRKVTFTLSNSNNDFDFVGRVIKIPCLFYFRYVKLHYVEETHDVRSVMALMKIVVASQHKRQRKNLCQDLLTI